MKTKIVFNSKIHFIGVLCKRGHDYNNTGKTVRHIKSRSCIMCGRLDYYKNREKVLERNRSDKYRTTSKRYTERKKQERLPHNIAYYKFTIPIPQAVLDERKLYYQRERYHNKKKHDLKFQLNKRISNSIRKSLIGGKGGHSWIDLVDYSLGQLKKRLEATLPNNATWQDFIEGKLDIDHIIPKAVFNYSTYTDIDFQRCWSLSNLQLLWSKDNQRKCAKITKDFQPSLRL